MHQAKTAMCFRNGALLCAILILNIQGCSQSIESAVDTETKKFHFKEIATACINFHDANAKFPFPEPFSDTVHKDISWRVLASLYCDGEPTYMAFDVDEPWDSKNNLPLSKQMHTPFGFGSSGEKTSVCWIKANDKTFKTTSIRDGSANTIMLMENPNKVVWSQPSDLTIDQAVEAVKNLPDGEQLVISFYDASTYSVSNKMDLEQFKAMLTHNGGEIVDKSTIK